MSREVEMTEKTVMTTDTSCGSLNTQAYDLKSHACSLPQPILKKAAYVGSNKQELIKAVSQSLMEAVNSGEIYDLLDVFNKAGLEFTEEMICELEGKLNAREMRELERQIQEIRLVLEKKEAEESFQERSESVTDLRADLSAENGDEKSVAFPDTQNDDHEKCGEAEGQNSTAEKQKAESSSLKKEGKEEDGDQARHCEQTQGMQGQNLAQVQVQEESEDDGTTSFSNIFVRIFGGLLRKWKEASKKSQFVAEEQSDDRDVVVLEGDTGRQAMPDEDRVGDKLSQTQSKYSAAEASVETVVGGVTEINAGRAAETTVKTAAGSAAEAVTGSATETVTENTAEDFVETAEGSTAEATAEQKKTTENEFRKHMGCLDNECMPVSQRRNHTEPTDMTREKRKALRESKPEIARVITTIISTTGPLAKLFQDAFLTEPDKLLKTDQEGQKHLLDTRDQSHVEYPATVLLLTALLAHMTGIESWRKLDTDLLNSTSIDTIGKMAGCPGNFTDAPGDYKLDRLPDQETINEAFTVFYNNVEKHGLEDPFQKLMFSILKKLIKTKKLDQGRFQKCIRIILDGTNFATFKKRHCEHCLTQTHIVDGKEVTYYMHKALVAIVMITEDIGIPIAVEFIENENPDVSKQDCENKAAKRLLRKLRKEFPRVRFMVQGDALYGVKPLLDLCTEYDWLAAFTVKETTQKTIVQEFVSNYDNPGMEDEYTIVENVLRTKKGNNEHGTLIFRNGLEGFLPERKGRKVKDRNSGDGEAVPIVSSKISMMVYAHQVPIGSEEDEYYKTMNQKEQESENNADLSTAMASMAQNLAARSTEMLLQDHAVQKKWKGVKKENLKVLYFAWIYNFDIRKEFAEELVRVGRGRWKIETTFFTQKHGSLRLEHVWCREYGAMKMHFWLIQLADLIQTLHMLYDLAASQAYSCYKDFVKELARSFTRDSLDAPGIREFIVKRRKMFKHTG